MKLLLIVLAMTLAPTICYGKDLIRLKRGAASVREHPTHGQCQLKCGEGFTGGFEEKGCLCRKPFSPNERPYVYISRPKKSSE